MKPEDFLKGAPPKVVQTSSFVGDGNFKIVSQPTVETQSAPIVPTDIRSETASIPATGKESPLAAAGKAAANIPASAINFGKGLIDFFNPLNTIKTAEQTGTTIGEALNEGQTPADLAVETVKAIPGEAYKAVVPQFLQHVFSGDLEKAAATVENDPVGQIAPLLLAARGAAEKVGKVAEFDSAISKMSSPVTETGAKIAEAAKTAVTAPSRFAVSQGTGLAPETISQIFEDPAAFTKQAQSVLSRDAIAGEVRTAIGNRSKELQATGKEYEAIRGSDKSVIIPTNIIPETLAKFGVKLDENGLIQTNAESRPLSPADRTSLQQFIDSYSKEETLSANGFLNVREALSNLARYGEGKTTITKTIAADLRKAYDIQGKDQLPELRDLDAKFAPEKQVLTKALSEYIERGPNGFKLKDSAVNAIANATGKGKDAKLARLEELSPGITQKIKTLKAVEDIQAASGNKVGTYVRAGGLVGGAATLNPFLVVGSILAVPEIAVPLLRGIGMGRSKINGTLKMLNVPKQFLLPISGSDRK